MRRKMIAAEVLAIAASAMVVPTSFGIDYRETWNSYATGTTDPTYNQVWSAYTMAAGTIGDVVLSPVVDGDVPVIGTSGSISTPNSIQYANKNRTLVNSLVDGVANGTLDGTEMSAGQSLIPDQAMALNTTNTLANVDNLQLRISFQFGSTGSNRARTAAYAELGSGALHAPALTGALEPLATAIPLIAIGKLTSNFTNAANTANAQNTSPYFFDGKQWLRLGNLGVLLPANHVAAKIFYDGASTYGWSAYIQFLAGTGTTVSNYTLPLQFDPTVGFDTVSYVLPNQASPTPSGTLPSFDDIWVAGGLVVPEPATMALLGFGFLAICRRRSSR